MGVRFADFLHPMKMKYFGLTETKLFHFHRILKNGDGEGSSSETPYGSATVKSDVYCIFVTFPCCILGQVLYLIVLFPDLCRLSYFVNYPTKK